MFRRTSRSAAIAVSALILASGIAAHATPEDRPPSLGDGVGADVALPSPGTPGEGVSGIDGPPVTIPAGPGDTAGAGTPAQTLAPGSPPVESLPVETLPPTRVIDFLDIDDVPEGNPAYELALQVRELRGRVDDAIAAAEEAEKEAAESRRLLEQAEFDYTVAAVRAEHLQRIVNRWAAGLHRNDNGGDDIVSIVNEALDDPAKMLDSRVWFSGIGAGKSVEIASAQELLAEAGERRDLADQQATRAERAENRAKNARANATRQLEFAKRTLERILGQTVSEQLIVGPDGCPLETPENTMRGAAADMSPAELCARSVAEAATPEAALAIKYAFRALGADYACEGIGRWEPFRYDCSSLVVRAYKEGAGLNMTSVGYIPSTRNLVPWNGVELAPWAEYVDPAEARPGDLILYDAGRVDTRHVVMLLTDGLMLHVGACEDVVHVNDFWGYTDTDRYKFLVARRINPDLARYPGQTPAAEPDASTAPAETRAGTAAP